MSSTGKFEAEIAPLLLNFNNETEIIPAIAQDFVSKEVLMLAWMNREALKLTAATGTATYWSRSRNAIWVKVQLLGIPKRFKN